jgi:hypothetical protein
MRTFKFDFQLEVRAVVPESFLVGQIDAAGDPDRTPFQSQLLAKYHVAVEAARGDAVAIDVAGDEFLLELIGNGLRHGLRGHAVSMLESSALGGTVAPVRTLERIAMRPEPEQEASMN